MQDIVFNDVLCCAELFTWDSKSGFFGSAGSIPALGTIEDSSTVQDRPQSPIATQHWFFLCPQESNEKQ